MIVMKKIRQVVCMNNIGAEAWLRRDQVYVVEKEIGFMDAVPGSREERVYYGNPEQVEERGLILAGVYAEYECGGRVAFKASRFRPAEMMEEEAAFELKSKIAITGWHF